MTPLQQTLVGIRRSINTALLYRRIYKGVAEDLEAQLTAAFEASEKEVKIKSALIESLNEVLMFFAEYEADYCDHGAEPATDETLPCFDKARAVLENLEGEWIEAQTKAGDGLLEAAKTALEDIDMALSGEWDVSQEGLEATKSTLEIAIEAYHKLRGGK